MPPDSVAFLIPEYPGQTHVFFRREMQALARLGVRAEVISTRRPPPALIAHSWSTAAIADTIYLFPPRPGLILRGLIELSRAGPRRWWRCLRTVWTGEGSGWSRVKRLPLVFFAAMLAGALRQKSWPHLHSHSCGNAADLALFMH